MVARYIVAGTINTLVYYMLYALFFFFSNHVVYAVIMASILGVLFSFYNFKHGVFHSRARKAALVWFYLVYGFTTAINMIVAWMFHNIFLLNGYEAGAFASAAAATLSYFCNRYFIFRT